MRGTLIFYTLFIILLFEEHVKKINLAKFNAILYPIIVYEPLLLVFLYTGLSY